MATNDPAKNFDVIGYDLTGAAETAIVIPVNTVRFIAVQCTTAVDAYISWQPNGTFDTHNRWTVKSGQILVLEDIAAQPTAIAAGGGRMFYMRGGAACTVEILYAQG